MKAIPMNKPSKMYSDYEYNQMKQQERKEHKQFRNMRQGRKTIWMQSSIDD
tara:strand:+ start:83725 stop:83877 length:153 start_codon:yes stop_codon:yes gene_type:complete